MRTMRWCVVAALALCAFMAPAAAQVPVLGPQRVAVVLLNWRDVQAQPTSVARAVSDMTAVRAWYQQASYGAMDLPFDVYGWVTADVSASGQCMTGLADDYGTPLVVAQIGQAKWDTYAKRLWVLPTTAAPGMRCYPNAALCGKDAVVYDNVGPALHELGHTFCLPHVDARDKMNPGAGPWSFGPLAKTRLGWLDRTGQPSTRLVTTGGVYAIEGYETAPRGVKALRVRAKTGGLFGTLEYWVKSINAGEVAVQLGGNDVKLSGSDVVLDVGQSWTSPEGITLRTESASTAGASIRVAYAGETPAPPVAQSPGDTFVYVASVNEDMVRTVLSDVAGNVYVTGGISGPALGLTPQGMGAFLAKYDAAGTLLCAGLVDGPNTDRAYGMAWLPNGNLVIVGRAGDGLPTTAGVVQPAFGGDMNPNSLYGLQDGFVAEMSAATCQPVWVTYLGDRDQAVIRDVAAGPQGIYVAFTTTYVKPWFVRPDAWRATIQGTDGAVAQLSPDGRTVIEATLVGGSLADGGVPSIVQDASGVYVIFGTTSPDAFTTPGAAQTAYAGGARDNYVLKFAHGLRSVQYATFVGTPSGEGMETHHIALFPDGALALSVYTQSTWLLGKTCSGTGSDWGIAVINPSGTAFEAAECIGTAGGDPPEGIVVDAVGRLITTGYTSNAWGATQPRGGRDGVITGWSRALARLFDVRVGGTADDELRTVATHPSGKLLVGGTTKSVGLGTNGTVYRGNWDGWWALVSLPLPPGPNPCEVDPLLFAIGVTSASHQIASLSGSVTGVDVRGCSATVVP